ncbi:hypothetical protein GJ744_009263 [Endocarpon pusillum]|uniref:Uncharacterized protein n=1 Tax=Endocarpon pusillum TaxID=364733 RepID=A0A8H7AFX9_9EURO|nr:hypothetical protein GJ744_009263 [Endocarpon pusillum]
MLPTDSDFDVSLVGKGLVSPGIWEVMVCLSRTLTRPLFLREMTVRQASPDRKMLL